MKEFINGLIGIIGGMTGFLFGALDGIFYALLAFIVLDYISGVACAFVNKKLSSAVGFKGIVKKVLLLSIVAVANIIDVQVIGDGSAVRSAVIFVFLANEGISIVENAASIGVPIPEALVSALRQIKLRDKDKK